ncbi:MAG TPA: hypothetical protein HPQ00_13750, partial [Magnetococcales bacterium]|nr:hypothetical protein [Magnetococcales bacterium]
MSAKATNETEPVSLEQTIFTLAKLMSRDAHEGGLSSGDMAELRRWRHGETVPASAWRLLVGIIDSEARLGQEDEERWFAVLSGMAQMAPHPHQRGLESAPGRVLAAQGYSENRFLKLIDSH